ncbi:MAG: Na/Pi cotransporter family protein [Phycisphaerales bacterium]|nr:Na/Pi cotransporter family protein [Phycisphaerales bacterium]
MPLTMLAQDGLDVAGIVIGMLGGLSLFLFGMTQMTDAMKAVAGEGLRAVLGRLTRGRLRAAATGAAVTAVIQSSSVTTVLVVGFVSAGFMSLSQSIGVIMGANIGTTITAQIIAFKVTAYALVLVTIGFGLTFAGRGERVKHVGFMIMGLGLVFFGMDVMGDATGPLRTFEPFITFMRGMQHPLAALAAGALFTALVQSSSATVGIVIVLAGQGFITLEAGIALTLGANVGTCVTAVLAAIGKPRAAMQTAAVHVLFNILGAIVWLPFVDALADLARAMSPTSADLAADMPRQVANANLLFNVLNTAVLIWFTGPLAWLVKRMLPDRAPPRRRAEPRFLDDFYLDSPGLGLDRLRMEIGRLGEFVGLAVTTVSPESIAQRMTPPNVEPIIADIRGLDDAIVGFAHRLLVRTTAARDARRLQRLLMAANHLLSIADTIGINFAAWRREWDGRRLHASLETRDQFVALHARVADAVTTAVRALRDADLAAADGVIAMEPEIHAATERLAQRLAARLVQADPQRVAVYRLESEVIEILDRLYYFAERIARLTRLDITDADGPIDATKESPT